MQALSIQVNNLVKTYGTQNALNDISFEINSGQVVGFLGPNGAGKSTTMKILTCYINATSGSAFVNGIDVLKNPLDVRKKIGYLPEHNPMYMDQYVSEYLRFCAELYNIKNVRKRVAHIIKETGLSLEKHKQISQLSKGYRQRVGLAQALIHNPDVLILDEPTSGLDPNQVIEIRELIKKVGQEKTVMLSTHIMQEVEAICDKVIIIDKGNIVANDSIQNIRKGKNDKAEITVTFSDKPNITGLNKLFGNDNFSLNENTLTVLHSKADVTKKQIMQFAFDNNLTILILKDKENSLEEIFQKLTKNVDTL